MFEKELAIAERERVGRVLNIPKQADPSAWAEDAPEFGQRTTSVEPMEGLGAEHEVESSVFEPRVFARCPVQTERGPRATRLPSATAC